MINKEAKAASWADVVGGSNGGLVPTGSIFYFALPTAPNGYLVCDGSAVSRTLYPSLFALLGTMYGAGNGSTTFNLPELRGEFLRSFDGGRGLDVGRNFGTIQTQSFQSHNHGIIDPGHYHAQATQNGVQDGIGRETSVYNNGEGIDYADGVGVVQTDTRYTGITISNSGTAETRPRNVALLVCIKY